MRDVLHCDWPQCECSYDCERNDKHEAWIKEQRDIMTIPYLEKLSSDPSLPMNKPIARRSQMQKWHAAERAIFEAVQAVETMDADPRLTQAINLLKAAKSQVADFIDGVTRSPLHEDEQGFHYVIDGERVAAAAFAERPVPGKSFPEIGKEIPKPTTENAQSENASCPSIGVSEPAMQGGGK